jgi:hypothetical protein
VVSVTVPRAGDYLVSFGGFAYGSAAGITANISLSIGGGAASDNDAVTAVTATGNSGYAGSRSRLKTGLSASNSVALRYKVSGGTGNFSNRWLAVLPVSVT